MPRIPNATTAAELMTKTLADFLPTRKPRVKISRGYVSIRTEWHVKHYDSYDFKLGRIDTPQKLLGWVHHLTEKVWFDRLVARELIEKVADRFGFDLDEG